MSAPIRVLVVDDSAFARKVLREVLASDARIQVVGIARDGIDALEKVTELQPDVMTLDLVMPELDGLGVLNALGSVPSPPAVVVVSMSDAESELGVAALQAGAFDVIHKPTALATERLYELRREAIDKVVAAAESRRRGASEARASQPPPSPRHAPRNGHAPRGTQIVAIGASTGGPQAIARLLKELPSDIPVAIAIVMHMPPGYTEAFAARLAQQTPFDVREAAEGLVLRAGRAVIGRAGMHFRVRLSARGLLAELDAEPLGSLHRPSVDELFFSVATQFGSAALGVVLTGMGTDGLAGSKAIRERGGRILAESASSCVVDGMPRAVREAGAATAEAPLEHMAEAIVRAL